MTSTPSNLGFLPGVEPSADPIHGEGVTILIWVSINGTHAEFKHTVRVGDVSSARRDALAGIEVIRAKILAMLKPGVPLNELYDTACARLTEHGYTHPGHIGHVSGSALASSPAQNFTTHLPDTIVITETK